MIAEQKKRVKWTGTVLNELALMISERRRINSDYSPWKTGSIMLGSICLLYNDVIDRRLEETTGLGRRRIGQYKAEYLNTDTELYKRRWRKKFADRVKEPARRSGRTLNNNNNTRKY